MSSAIGLKHISKLEALINLLDDDAPVVREAVARELKTYGGDVGPYLYEHHVVLDDLQWLRLHHILFENYKTHLLQEWPLWMLQESEAMKLETALALLAHFQNGPQYRPPFSEALDQITLEYKSACDVICHETLASFLFAHDRIVSVEEADEDVRVSNLSYVLEKGRGLPVSLVCLYLLIANRNGLQAAACSWPGYFYVRFQRNEQTYLIDCANRGMIIEADELLRLQGPSREAAQAALTVPVNAGLLIRRVLSNLAFAYRREGDTERSLLMLDLLRTLDRPLR